MTDISSVYRLGLVFQVLACLLCLLQAGCITGSYRAIAAADLPLEFQPASRCDQKPVNLSLLRQEPPKEYLLGGGDMVGVYVPTVLPATPAGGAINIPLIPASGLVARDVYPPTGFANVPNTGVPLTLGSDGTLALPRIEPLELMNVTLTEAANQVRKAYNKAGILAEGQPVVVTLLKPRVHRVLVLREDTGAIPTLILKGQAPYTRSGRGDVVDLPAFAPRQSDRESCAVQPYLDCLLRAFARHPTSVPLRGCTTCMHAHRRVARHIPRRASRG